VRSYKRLLATLALLFCFGISALPQNQPRPGITPQPPEGQGVVVLKAARLIDGTGAPPSTTQSSSSPITRLPRSAMREPCGYRPAQK